MSTSPPNSSSRGRPKKQKRSPPQPKKQSKEPNSSDSVNTPSKPTDDALNVLFNLVVHFLGKTPNLWFTPSEIAAALRGAGVSSNKLHGDHIRQVITKFSRRGIIESHQLKLPGASENRLSYYRLASVSDEEVPLAQRVDGKIIASFSFDAIDVAKGAGTSECLASIEAFCGENEVDKDVVMSDNASSKSDSKDCADSSSKVGANNNVSEVACLPLGSDPPTCLPTIPKLIDTGLGVMRLRGGGDDFAGVSDDDMKNLDDLSDKSGYRIVDIDLEFDMMQAIF